MHCASILLTVREGHLAAFTDPRRFFIITHLHQSAISAPADVRCDCVGRCVERGSAEISFAQCEQLMLSPLPQKILCRTAILRDPLRRIGSGQSRVMVDAAPATAQNVEHIPAQLLAAAQEANQAHIFEGWGALTPAQRERLLTDASVSSHCAAVLCAAASVSHRYELVISCRRQSPALPTGRGLQAPTACPGDQRAAGK